jgi:SAM-dependent methyltransferase
MVERDPSNFYERAYDYFLAEIYDDWYGFLSDKSQGPFWPVISLIQEFRELASRPPSLIRVLDCACGTGNLFIALTEEHYDAWASDGSPEMLNKAIRNCEKLPTAARQKLIAEPIRWTDRSAFEALRERAGLFDLVVVPSNSFCHIPATDEYMQLAIANFLDMLHPGGFLFIDTKKYIETAPIDGVQIFRELRFIEADAEWIVRYEREEVRKVDQRDVHFHTRLHYDIDPSFSRKICRALLTVTRYGNGEAPRTMVLPYYPLPAKVLEGYMKKMKLVTRIFSAKAPPTNWTYDFVVGQKP